MPNLRRFLLVSCLGLLAGLFVIGGMGYPASPSPGVDLADPGTDPVDHMGERVETGGTVVDTDPTVFKIEDSGDTERLPVENPPDVEEDQELILNGTITETGALDARTDRAVVREPWERTYMYVISMIAALIVATRGIDGWRLDRDTLTVRPRETPLHDRYLRDRASADPSSGGTDDG
jgi:hypothetical protein